MITARAFAGKRYAVLGLARSGLATVDALLASGAAVVAWDENAAARAKILPGTGRGTAAGGSGGGGPPSELALGDGSALAGAPSTGFAGPPPRPGEDLILADPLALDLSGFDGIVVSPGVPLNRHPIAAHARSAGVPIIGDIELFAQARGELPPHKVVGITGTNGKSTTTALVHHILKTAGVPTTMGGNIGLPILAQDPLPEGGVYVLELSSYQIDLTYSLDCDVAVLLNITPDHLDRYESLEAYAASKARLLEMQSPNQHALVDTETVFDFRVLDRTSATIVTCIEDVMDHDFAQLRDRTQFPTLQGPHNLDNMLAAIGVSDVLGLDVIQIRDGLRTYPGLPHRMERIRDKDGILFVNDSKATNPTSTAPALAAYPAVHWILGGLPKSDDLDACAPHFDHVRAAYTIGTAGPMFAAILRDAGKAVTESRVLTQAVTDAAAAAKTGEVVLLSPACASFDQFSDYEARGAAFRAAVEAL